MLIPTQQIVKRRSNDQDLRIPYVDQANDTEKWFGVLLPQTTQSPFRCRTQLGCGCFSYFKHGSIPHGYVRFSAYPLSLRILLSPTCIYKTCVWEDFVTFLHIVSWDRNLGFLGKVIVIGCVPSRVSSSLHFVLTIYIFIVVATQVICALQILILTISQLEHITVCHRV